MSRHFIGLPGFMRRLEMVPPTNADPDEYANFVRSELGLKQTTSIAVLMDGHKASINVNPSALMWWYVTDDSELRVDDIDAAWPRPEL